MPTVTEEQERVQHPDVQVRGSSSLGALTAEQVIPFIDSIDSCIYVLDAEGNFVYVNSAFVKYTETPKDVLLRTNVNNIKHTFHPSISEKVMRGKKQCSMFQEIVTATKKRHRQLAVGIPIFDAEGNVKYIIVTVTCLEHFNDQMQEAQQETVSRHIATHEDTSQGTSRTIIGRSPQMQALFSFAQKIALTDSTCLLLGETGTGKEVLAQFIHASSLRNDKPLVIINCAAVPETLLEAELFGYESGAFTGAARGGKTGTIEAADGGTLFLDEINSLPLSMQGKLLRVLETKKIRKIGGISEKKIDFRLIVASNKDLYKMCQEGAFREDLYYRINLSALEIPPLRERVQDIIPLSDNFLEELGRKYGKNKIFSRQCYESLLNYSWPGNVRELRNLVERMLIISNDDVVVINTVPDQLFLGAKKRDRPQDQRHIYIGQNGNIVEYCKNAFSLNDYLDSVEKDILNVMANTYGNTYKIGEILKINQSSVVRKMKKHGIQIAGKRTSISEV